MLTQIKRIILTYLGIITVIVLFSSQARAEENRTINLSAQSRFQDREEVNAMPGQIRMTESQTRLVIKDKISGKLPIDVSLMVKHIDIDEDLAVELPSHLEARELGLGTKFPLPFVERDDLFVGVDIFPTLNTDDWDWEDSAFRLPFRTYLIYKAQEELIFVLGLQVCADYDQVILPVIGLLYKPNDRLSFNLASAEPNISYEIDEKMTVFWEFDYDIDEYEVDRGADQNVVLKYRQLTTGWGFKYALTEMVEASLSTGVVFARRLQFEDNQGKVEADPTVYVTAGLKANF